jgi:hypothetical protein
MILSDYSLDNYVLDIDFERLATIDTDLSLVVSCISFLIVAAVIALYFQHGSSISFSDWNKAYKTFPFSVSMM